MSEPNHKGRGVIITNSLRISKRSRSCSNFHAVRWAFAAAVLLAAMLPANAQVNTSAAETDTKTELHQLHSELDETRTQLSRAQDQIGQLATELEALRREFTARAPLPPEAPTSQAAVFPSAVDLARLQQSGSQSLPESVAGLNASQKVLTAQIEEQHQTKVESESKYRVKVSGLLLMNAFSNRGGFDVADLPKVALASEDNGVGATVRQSIIGLQVFGPKLAGAATSASISADFFGGFPEQQPYGTTLGVLRLRQASAHLDWTNTSLIVGQETLFFSPLSPTSYASLAEPAFSYSGNLWAWTPQVVAEHRFHTSDQAFFSLSGGLLAPLAESVVQDGIYPVPGQRPLRPAFASQIAFHTKVGQSLAVGVGGYVSHLRDGYNHETNSWAVTSFWRFPFGSLVELSGAAYRGKAVGGLGGGIWQSVVYDDDPAYPSTRFRPLNALGGWTQLKFHPLPKWEFNAAVGQDNVYARDLEWAPILQGAYTTDPLARNRATFGNAIFRPKSNLLLSVEYRKIWTYGYKGDGNSADQVNVGAGVSF